MQLEPESGHLELHCQLLSDKGSARGSCHRDTAAGGYSSLYSPLNPSTRRHRARPGLTRAAHHRTRLTLRLGEGGANTIHHVADWLKPATKLPRQCENAVCSATVLSMHEPASQPVQHIVPSSQSLGGKVAEAVGGNNVGHAQTRGVKGRLQGLGRVGVLDVGAGDSRIDEGHDAAEGLGGGQAGIAADVGNGLGAGVEVLLGGHELCGPGKDLGVVAELGYNLVGELELSVAAPGQPGMSTQRVYNPSPIMSVGTRLCRYGMYFCTRVGTGEQDAGGLTGESASGAGSAKAGQRLDGGLNEAFLTEACLAHGRKSDEKERLGIHDDKKK